ncbi:MAG TPA: acetate--CoA ligase family protein [Casimicrobiaceae bacterium]|nr:acetate--CoA ligase family protein [Casimicrobiaceae bacterium]
MKDDGATLVRRAREAHRRALAEPEGKALLAAFGVPVPRSVVVRNSAEVASALGSMPAPFAAKVVSPDVLHKSDAGGVTLGLASVDDVRRALDRMSARMKERGARVDGFLVEEMQGPGIELVVGATRDRQFGPMLMVGLGGIFVEILRDVAFRLCPIGERDARAMLRELRGAALLDGARGRPAVDRDALVELLLRIGGPQGLVMKLRDDVDELDVNPLIAAGRKLVAVDARIVLAATASSTRTPRVCEDDHALVARFEPLVRPASIAVLGASSTSTTIANTFIRRLRAFGYGGAIYPIHPTASAIEELPCYASLAETPQPIDYAYVAIGARAIPDVLCRANGRVRFAQVISSGFGEVEEGAALEADLVAKSREGGCRVIGPNCLGLYSPRGGVTFPADAPREVGGVGVVCQSGGLGTDIIKRGSFRGLRFSVVITAGNCADLTPVDLIEFLFADPVTKVIGLYVEDIKDGRGFFELLQTHAGRKPVVILWGGRTGQGRLAAASHTGAIAGNRDAWIALSMQTGCVLVDTVDQFIGALLAFQFLPLRRAKPTRRVVLFGNGGGTSVLAADAFAERGLEVLPFDEAVRAKLAAMKLPPGTSIANPIDAPVATLQQDEGRVANAILDVVCEVGLPDALVVHINLAAFVGRGDVDPIDNLIEAAVQTHARHAHVAHLVVVLRVDGSPELDERRRRYRRHALERSIPVYDELVEAADALRAVSFVERHGEE